MKRTFLSLTLIVIWIASRIILVLLLRPAPSVLTTFHTDSIVDAPVPETFGHPVAVYPDSELASLAAARSWPVIAEKGCLLAVVWYAL